MLSSACFKLPSHSLRFISRVFALHTKSLNSHFPDQNHRQELCSRPFLSISLALLFSLSHQTLVFSFERSALTKTPQQRTSQTTEKLLRGAWAWPVSNPTTESVCLLLISPFVALMLYFPICWIQIRFFSFAALGVSGGPDSIALCVLASGWKEDGVVGADDRSGWIDGILGIVVDHGLRPESGEEAKRVCDWVSKMGTCDFPLFACIWLWCCCLLVWVSVLGFVTAKGCYCYVVVASMVL